MEYLDYQAAGVLFQLERLFLAPKQPELSCDTVSYIFNEKKRFLPE
jgi:hypothetical protein